MFSNNYDVPVIFKTSDIHFSVSEWAFSISKLEIRRRVCVSLKFVIDCCTISTIEYKLIPTINSYRELWNRFFATPVK
jgi:hypothetical protein